MLRHKINITVKKPGEASQKAIRAGDRKIHRRFFKWLLGDELNVLVVSPGNTVQSVEIKEVVDDIEKGENT